MPSIDRIEEPGRCILRVRGELRLPDARELFERALQEDCERLLLDFSACEVEDRALSALAEFLSQAHLRVGASGLRERQLRLLQYLGVTRAAEG